MPSDLARYLFEGVVCDVLTYVKIYALEEYTVLERDSLAWKQ